MTHASDAETRWRIVGRVLASPHDPRVYADIAMELEGDDPDGMTAMRFVVARIESERPDTRGRPFMFTSITRE
jgi:hypothetical protein